MCHAGCMLSKLVTVLKLFLGVSDGGLGCDVLLMLCLLLCGQNGDSLGFINRNIGLQYYLL